MAAVQFHEVQKANSPLFLVLTLLAPALMLAILIYQLLTGTPVGNHPASNLMLLIMIPAFALPAILLVTRLKLTTIIDPEAISYGFNFPTAELNKIKLVDIKECYLTEYRFAGFGYRISRKYGLMYNMRGKKGIQIVKHSGEMILIGTQKWEELKDLFEKKERS